MILSDFIFYHYVSLIIVVQSSVQSLIIGDHCSVLMIDV
jgi:hypothetical protein